MKRGRILKRHSLYGKRVTLPGDGKELNWSLTKSGLVVEMPDKRPCDHAYIVTIERLYHPKLN